MPKQMVALVIRAREALTDEFMDKVRIEHPEHEIEFRDIDPRNARETYEAAKAAGSAVIVILRPDPLIAELVANDVPCIPIAPGPLNEIAAFEVNLRPYQPRD